MSRSGLLAVAVVVMVSPARFLAQQKTARSPLGSSAQAVPNLTGDWIYYGGEYQATITQTGSVVTILTAWTPSANAPGGEFKATLDGLALTGTYRCLVSPDTGPCKDTAGKNFKFSATVDQDGNTIRVSDDSYELPGDRLHGLVWTRKPTSVTKPTTSPGAPEVTRTIRLYNTGFDGTGRRLTKGGQPDGHWKVRNQSAVLLGSGAAYGTWPPNSADSQWIGLADTQTPGSGPYTFETLIDLSGLDPQTAAISGNWSLDDSGTMLLNGKTVATLPAGGWISMHPFSTAAGGGFFVARINHLQITLDTDNNWDGIRWEGLVTANVREPVTAGTFPVATIANGDFENVRIPCPPCLSSEAASVPGWTHSGPVGDALIWRVGNSEQAGNITTAGSGQQFVTLGGGKAVGGTASWSTEITNLVKRRSYHLSFDMAREESSAAQSITVDFTSGSAMSAQTFTASSYAGNNWKSWEPKKLIFVATDTRATVRFSVVSLRFDVGLDNVRVSGPWARLSGR